MLPTHIVHARTHVSLITANIYTIVSLTLFVSCSKLDGDWAVVSPMNQMYGCKRIVTTIKISICFTAVQPLTTVGHHT